MSELGLVHVYTGEGKGKTTAALGLALRSWGHGLRVCIIQFMKHGEDYGEVQALRRLEGIDLYQFGSDHFIDENSRNPEDIELAHRALKLAKDVLCCQDYDVVILDEINMAMYFGLIPVEGVLDALHCRTPGVEVVLTGRNAPNAILDEADLITQMVAMKHPYESGVMARKGVEY
jgi:cob(I)alamin adenosyltransferase